MINTDAKVSFILKYMTLYNLDSHLHNLIMYIINPNVDNYLVIVQMWLHNN